jgi:hypothetical protein
MKFSTLIAIAITLPTVAVATTARADQATMNTVVQEVVVTGNGNRVRQSSRSSVENSSTRNHDSRGVDVRTVQKADILGDDNTLNQQSDTRSRSIRSLNQ